MENSEEFPSPHFVKILWDKSWTDTVHARGEAELRVTAWLSDSDVEINSSPSTSCLQSPTSIQVPRPPPPHSLHKQLNTHEFSFHWAVPSGGEHNLPVIPADTHTGNQPSALPELFGSTHTVKVYVRGLNPHWTLKCSPVTRAQAVGCLLKLRERHCGWLDCVFPSKMCH